MPSTPSPLLRVNLQATGENLNTWGTKANNEVFKLLEEAIAGVLSLTVSGPVTLTSTNYASDQARNMVLNCTGTGGTVTVPAFQKVYIVRNATTGSVVISGSGSVDVTILAGNSAIVFTDGTDVFEYAAVDQTGKTWVFSTPTVASQPATKGYVDTGDAAGLVLANAFTTAQILAASISFVPAVVSEAGKSLHTDGTTLAWDGGVSSHWFYGAS